MNECSVLLGRALLTRCNNTQDPLTKAYSLSGVKCKGALRALETSFYGSNFSPFKIKRRAQGGSSRELGDSFHRHVFHKYMCVHVECKCARPEPPLIDLTDTSVKKKPAPRRRQKKCRCKPRCLCKERFGSRTRSLKRTANVMQDLLESFNRFLDETGLYVYDCEMIVGCEGIRVATSIDVVCVDSLKKPTQVFVVELKTGYTVQLKKIRTITGTGNYMSGDAGATIENSMFNHHQLQLWFGVEALKRTHGIRAAGGYVVYVNRGHRLKYYPAEAWWFKSARMSAMMFRQLEISCL